jgi:hypothetical protein
LAGTSVKGGYESFQYEDGSEEDGKNARKKRNDRNATKDLKFALPPTMALNIFRAMFFDPHRA